MTSRTSSGCLSTAAAVLALALTAAGCGTQGPAPARDGTYRLLATSTGDPPDGSAAVIADGTLTLVTSAGTTIATLGEKAPRAVLCPDERTGQPVRLAARLAVAGVEFTSPAVFGDCGVTSPSRITVVDLDAPADSLPAFRRWAEFCLTADPDCPAR